MKLIDLLVRELPKRGGWPDGAEAVVQDADDMEFYFYTGGPVENTGKSWWFKDHVDGSRWIFYEGKFEVADDHDTASVTLNQYQSALAASQNVEWSGGGFPPVGCECEARYREADGAEWFFFRCVGVDCGVAFGWAGKDAVTLDKGSYEFRPLRSEADKKRDEAAKEMARHANDDENRGFDAGLRNCLSIYDAIAAGKIPGVKLED